MSTITGTSGNDTLTGGSGDDTITGGDGNDTIDAGSGKNTIDAGNGDDIITDSGTGSSIEGWAGTDTLHLDRSALGTSFKLIFRPAWANDPASDGTTINSIETLDLTTGAGNDVVSFDLPETGTGTQIWHAGAGTDTANVDAFFGIYPSGVVTSLSAGVLEVRSGAVTVARIYDAEVFGLAGSTTNDNLAGGAGDDHLWGRDGSDVLYGLSGNDTIDGGAGADVLDGGAGDDLLLPGYDNDTVRGGSGNDTVSYRYDTYGATVNLSTGSASGTYVGTDTLQDVENAEGGWGDDTLTGDSGANALYGRSGNDVLKGGAGNDRLDGGRGVDKAVFSGTRAQYTVTSNGDGSTTVSGVDGVDTVVGVEQLVFDDQTVALNVSSGAFNMTVNGGRNDIFKWVDALVTGTMSSNTAAGFTVTYTLPYSAHNKTDVSCQLNFTGTGLTYDGDVVTGGTLTGITETDWTSSAHTGYYARSTWSGFTVSVADVTAAINANNDVAFDEAFGIDRSPAEVLVNGETGFNDLFFSGNDTFTANFGSCTFSGYGGDDVFNMSAASSATVAGGDGNDVINMGAVQDYTVDGGNGDDVFNFTTGFGYSSNDWVYGGGGSDTINLNGDYSAAPGNGRMLSIGSVELLKLAGGHSYSFWARISSSGTPSMTIDGSALGSGDKLYLQDYASTTANLTVLGGAGDDTIQGSAGSDTLSGGTGNDSLDGRGGNDTAKFSGNRSAYTVTANANGSYTVTGTDGTDTLTNIEMLQFADQSVTPANAAASPPPSGGQTISGTSGADTLTGGSDNDTISGGAGNDIINGGAGADTLNGGADEDTITGGAGNDTLDGGSSVDTAVFSGNRAAYTITQTSTGNFTITGTDGTDTLTNIEYAKFDDLTLRLLPGSGTTVNFANDPSTYMAGIRDFDGNDLGGAASWKLIGTADVDGDGRAEHILFNRAIGRWAEVGTEADGLTYYSNYNWAGDTRVVGIYIDPLVANGTVVKNSDTDSQRRFQNDLQIDNIKSILGQGDYDHNGLQEVYFSLTDGTAYLHAYMHADGNIQYANYQNKQQVIDYLTANGVAPSTWATWFPASQAAMEVVTSDPLSIAAAGSSAWGLATGTGS